MEKRKREKSKFNLFVMGFETRAFIPFLSTVTAVPMTFG